MRIPANERLKGPFRTSRSIWLAATCLALLPPRGTHADDDVRGIPAGATVHFLGDSIFKGWGFGKYDDPSPLCRIQDVCRRLARDNFPAAPKINWLYPRPGEIFKDIAGNPGEL